MLRFTAGDILKAKQHYIAQGVATGRQEGLGTGLALKISKRWPEVQVAFKKHTRSRKFGGGDIFVVPRSDERPGVVYLATQPDMVHATMGYLRRAARRLAGWAADRHIVSVALPKIGAGLGKLSWEGEVKPLLAESLTSGRTEFVVYEVFRNSMEAPAQGREDT